MELPEKYKSKSSQLIISSEELGENKEAMEIKFCGKGLDKKDMFGKSDPYLSIFKYLDDGSWGLVHKTEYMKNTLNPVWDKFKIRVKTLTGGKMERPIKLEVWDWNNDGSSDLIGEHITTFPQIQEGQSSVSG